MWWTNSFIWEGHRWQHMPPLMSRSVSWRAFLIPGVKRGREHEEPCCHAATLRPGNCAKHHASLLQDGTSFNTALVFLVSFQKICFIWVLQSQIGHEGKRWPRYVNPHQFLGWAGSVCPVPMCAALPPVCWRDTRCSGFALSFLLPIWHLFDHSVRKLSILFPIAFPAQIKGRICYLGFASLHGGVIS